MKAYCTIGIAGHTDHGKTTLVRSLTGKKDEHAVVKEKHRGITIEPAIYRYPVTDDFQVALIDTPGHARYVKNTIRGLASVDMGILVIAADDGIMPQTLEHLRILDFLGIDHGCIVLSKTDLVDEEILELAELEIQEAVQGTVLENKPVIHYSSETNRGLEQLHRIIREEMSMIDGKAIEAPFRMWIDRVRSIPGFGTVAAGTIWSGSIATDDAVQLLPNLRESRARTIQIHHQKVSQAVAGQRAGINLPKVSLSDVKSGMALSRRFHSNLYRFLNIELHASHLIQNNQRVKLHVGTVSINAMVTLMGRDRLNPGETGWAQLRLPEPIAAEPKDPFLISSLNTHGIMGGGIIFETATFKFKAKRLPGTLPYLEAVKSGDTHEIITNFCRQRLRHPVTLHELAEYTGIPKDQIESELSRMTTDQVLVHLPQEQYYLQEEFRQLGYNLHESISRLIIQEPFRGKISQEAILKHIASDYDESIIRSVLQNLHRNRKIVLQGGMISIPMDTLVFSKSQKKILDSLLRYSDEIGIPFTIGAFCRTYKKESRKDIVQPYIDFLQFQGKVIRLNTDCYISIRVIEDVKKKVAQAIQSKGSITVTDSKDVLGYGRTKGAPVLEYLDEIGFTFRKGNERVLSTYQEHHA